MIDAINASPRLLSALNELTSSGKLIALRVVPQSTAASMPKSGPFNAWISEAGIVFTDTMLLELQKNKLSDVSHANDIYPNNLTFVLGHLAYHLKTGEDIGTVAKSMGMQEFMSRRLESEASAFIQGWNDMTDAALTANGGRPLSPQQVASLFMNLRYRFAFAKALQQTDNKLQIAPSGFIEMSAANIGAIVDGLKTSPVADIQ